MVEFMKRTWVQIDLDTLRKNFEAIRQAVRPETKIMAVVKADAYGHGVEFTARELVKDGADWFAVSNLEEALQVRKAGIDKPILILGYTPPEYAQQLALNNISQAVFNSDYANKLSKNAVESGVEVSIHIKIDTGMTRIGFTYQDNVRDSSTVDDIEEVCKLKGLYKEGIFTHFAKADEGAQGEAYTRLQYELFTNIIDRLKARGIEFELRHCCNSAATVCYPEMQLDMVRPGIILYGMQPSNQQQRKLDLSPVMELKTVVSMIKKVDKDTSVSYGGTYTTDDEIMVATVPVGYADGYPRSLSNKGEMLVNGKRVKIIGRVCMDQLMLDVSGIDNISEGLIVTVFGKDDKGNSITADEIAQITGTINYEITCGISKRVPRVFIKDGKTLGITDYILSVEN
ncbi:MAG: alanine racemase [Clostridiales bacterium]|nr:alanine racemase [Clostridiales bacterium]